MPKKVSVKTVDGNRFDIIVNDNMTPVVDYRYRDQWLSFVDGSTRKFFYIPNIVSITETEIEDG